MGKLIDILNFIFPLYIINRDGVLYIEDRRPTLLMLAAPLAAVGSLIYAVYHVIYVGFDKGPWVPVGMGVAAVVLGIMAAGGKFRETYVFDKLGDTYTFTRQSLFKKEVIEGSLGQFRAVQVGEVPVDEDGVAYNVTLINDGPFMSGSETWVLRESTPIFGSLADEARIADAIARSLKIERIDTVRDDEELTLLKLT